MSDKLPTKSDEIQRFIIQNVQDLLLKSYDKLVIYVQAPRGFGSTRAALEIIATRGGVTTYCSNGFDTTEDAIAQFIDVANSERFPDVERNYGEFFWNRETNNHAKFIHGGMELLNSNLVVYDGCYPIENDVVWRRLNCHVLVIDSGCNYPELLHSNENVINMELKHAYTDADAFHCNIYAGTKRRVETKNKEPNAPAAPTELAE